MKPVSGGRMRHSRLLVLPGCAPACASDGLTGRPDPIYYAVVYGTVRQADAPLTGAEVSAEVYLGTCPPTGSAVSGTGTRTGAGGRYRLLLTSPDPAPGQCLRLEVAGAGPTVRTLAEMPFGATSAAAVRDSVQIDLVLP